MEEGGGGGVAAERQRQNATNSKRAEPCACIRNAIGPLSTGAGPLLSRAGPREGGGREEEEEEGEVVDGAKGQSCPRNPQSRENSDRSQGLISIFGRSFACSLFEHPTTKIPTTTTTTPGIAFENNIPRSRGLSFSPDLSRSKGLGTGEAQVSMAMILHPILPRYCLHQSSNGRHFDTIPFLFDGFF